MVHFRVEGTPNARAAVRVPGVVDWLRLREERPGTAGAKRHQLPDWEDPADELDPPEPPAAGEPGGRAADPAERATQIRSFLAAAGGEAG